MRVISLGSGSSGNALLVEAGPRRRTKVLIDAGLKGRLLIECLRRVGVSPTQLQGVLLTHEHSDHIVGLPTLMNRYAIPLIADPRTIEAVHNTFISGTWRTDSGSLLTRGIEPGTEMELRVVANKVIGEQENSVNGKWQGKIDLREGNHDQGGHNQGDRKGRPYHEAVTFSVGLCRMIGDIEVSSFPVSHDAVAPCGFLLSASGCRVCVVIDSGEVTPAMLEVINQADLLIIESNHDRERLVRGPYPQLLKERILSPTGHLSNDQAADAVLRTWRTDSVRWLWLSHLSRTNNTPQLALNSMRERIQAANANLSQVHITALPPGLGGVWDSTQLWKSPSLWEMPG